ncbi:ferredoxin [Kocuria palustris]|uniref:ferredoxin n=1 Tax=Kocuria palustris TaxID=71999 RepID=UPI0011A156D8|nr:ferredoxin [Kocuria palustris]
MTAIARIDLDRHRCEGHGLCEEAAPDLMHLDEEGELILDVTEIDADAEEALAAARSAVRVCPVAALKLLS